MTSSAAPAVPNPLGVRFVATWPQDCSGWQVERYEPSDPPMSAEAYAATLPTHATSASLQAFLGEQSPVAVFELECDGLRKAMGVKLVSWSVNPIFFRELLTAKTTPREIEVAHPVLLRLNNFDTYHWDTPGFLDLCEVMGLHPDKKRPRFRARYQELAQEVMRWSCTVAHRTHQGAWESPPGKAHSAAFKVLDMMRANTCPDPYQLDKLRDLWGQVDPVLIPRFDELDELINSDALLDPTDLDAGVIQPRDPPSARLGFLPSRHGGDDEVILTGYWGRRPPDGWVAEDHAGLRGIAIRPDGMEEQPWLRAAFDRLRKQGVLFLSPDEVRAYLTGKEATYWIWRQGLAARWPARHPTWLERMLWRMRPPKLPLDARLAFQDGAASAELPPLAP